MSERRIIRKYEALKDEVEDWRKSSEKWQNIANQLQEQLETLMDNYQTVNDKLESFKGLDKSKLHNLEEENNSLKESAKKFQKELRELKYHNATLERDLILKDGKIQQLDESRKDLKERYRELKEDFREQQKWLRSNKTN